LNVSIVIKYFLKGVVFFLCALIREWLLVFVAYVIFYCCFAYSHFEGSLKGFGFGHAEMPLPCCKIHSHDTHVRRRVM